MLFFSLVFHWVLSGLVWLYNQRTHPRRQDSDSDSNGYHTARDETAHKRRGAAVSQTSWSSRWPNSGVWGQVPREAQPKCQGHHCSGPSTVLNMTKWPPGLSSYHTLSCQLLLCHDLDVDVELSITPNVKGQTPGIGLQIIIGLCPTSQAGM